MRKIEIDIEAVKERYVFRGESTESIGKSLGVSQGVIMRALKGNGVNLRGAHDILRKHIQPYESEICKRYGNGESSTKLAQAFKCDKATILNVLKRHNVQRREPTYNLRGALSPNFVGIKRNDHGYIYVFQPGHPRADKAGRLPEHIVVAEEKIGRALLPDEVVHHIDLNGKNNDKENLWVYNNQAAHISTHQAIVKSVRRVLQAFGIYKPDTRTVWEAATRLVHTKVIIFKNGAYTYDIS